MNECHFSPCRKYRYSLLCDLREPLMGRNETLKTVAWIGLNPSTADENTLDPTLRRVRDFTLQFGGNSFLMLNLFAFRATDPREMKAQRDPQGPENDDAILRGTESAVMTICAWGCHGGHLGQSNSVVKMLEFFNRDLWALRLTGDCYPAHPLYLPKSLKPFRFSSTP